MGLTERHWFENEDVPENYEWALEDAVYNSRTNEKPEDSTEIQARKGCEMGRTDREKIISGLMMLADRKNDDTCEGLKCCKIAEDALALLKEQELPTELKQKMWNALYAEEDEYEKKFVGKEEHLNWFTVYRPWLQKGFDIAINAIADWEGR